MSRTIWIISGETSGDMYGAALARELWVREPQLTLKGMGGSAMRDAGVDIMVDSTELGVVGIAEVFKSIRFFIRLLKDMADRAERERPDAVVLIDYPGFNLRLAQRLHKAGITVIYYISPQVWVAVGKGKLLVCCADLESVLEHPEGRQFYKAVLDYMRSDDFRPSVLLDTEQLTGLFR